ncbi:MAG TPA: NADPH:quinone reductase [Microlunatus sp.]|nr:NADPH:quinone reductase [Microlunatus sp.]
MMRAVFYDRQGPAAEVLQIGELPDPEPGPGEVRVRLRYSGISPGDTKKRTGYFGSTMPYPRVVPHSDGSGVIDRVGDGVQPSRIGQRVWVYNAQSYRAFGTAADYTVVPEATAVPLPDEVDDVLGACLGIPGITAHRAVFADGPVRGQTVLVHGALGAVGSLAAQLATWGGATVIGTVRRHADLADLAELTGRRPERTVSLDEPDAEQQIVQYAPTGVDRIIEVAFSDNIDLDARVAANGAVIAAYATRDPRPRFDFWPMLFANLTIRLLGSDDFPTEAKQQAATELTSAARDGHLVIPIAPPLPLDQAAAAHDQVDTNNRHRVLLEIAD